MTEKITSLSYKDIQLLKKSIHLVNIWVGKRTHLGAWNAMETLGIFLHPFFNNNNKLSRPAQVTSDVIMFIGPFTWPVSITFTETSTLQVVWICIPKAKHSLWHIRKFKQNKTKCLRQHLYFKPLYVKYIHSTSKNLPVRTQK